VRDVMMLADMAAPVKVLQLRREKQSPWQSQTFRAGRVQANPLQTNIVLPDLRQVTKSRWR